MPYALKKCALSLASAALLAVAFTGIASADSLTSALSDPGSQTTAPNPCNWLMPCTLTLKGSQTSTPGGAGSYTIVDRLNTLMPYTTDGGNTYCVDLVSGSTINLTFSSGGLTMRTDGKFCGPQVTPTSYVFSGPYTITGGTSPFNGATGTGRLSVTYDLLSQSHHSSIGLSGTVNLPPLGGGGGGGGGGGLNATPELDSLVLFGSGALGLAGYMWTRVRRRRTSS